MDYVSKIGLLASEAKSKEHERHVYELSALCKEMIETLTPEIVRKELLNTYFDLWVKLRMKFEGKEIYFQDVADYVETEIKRLLAEKLK